VIYQASITTVAGTEETAKKQTLLKITKGLLFHTEVYFPPGSMGELRCIIMDGSFQLYPTTGNEALRGNDKTWTFEDLYLKMVEPFEVQVYTWSPDATFDHLVIVQCHMVSKEIFMARFLPTYSVDYQMKLLRQLERQQEAARQEQITNPFNI
jgi:hypothetical protein